MLRRLTVKNFQSHKNTTIEFCKGVNVIIGESGSGKSNLQRALETIRSNWNLCFKKKSRFAGADESITIEVLTDDNHEVKLERTKAGATYTCDKAQFRKCGASSVPDRVEQALRLTHLNIQIQSDSKYLIVSGPTEVAKAINDITGLEALDPAMTWLKRQISDKQSRAGVLRERLIANEKKLKAFEHLDTWKGKYQKIVKEKDRLAALQRESAALSADIERVRIAKRGFLEVRECDVTGYEKHLVEIDQTLASIGSKKSELLRLLSNLGSVKDAKKKLVSKEKVASARKVYEGALVAIKRCPFCFADLRGRIREIVNAG